MTPRPSTRRPRLAPAVLCLAALGLVASACWFPSYGRPGGSGRPPTTTTSVPDDPGPADPGPNDPPAEPETQWNSVLDGIGDDGTVDLDTALRAFAVAIGPIPGAAPDTGLPPGDLASGTGALRWLLAHWDELGAEQRAAIAAALTDTDAAGPAGTDPGGVVVGSARGRSRAAGPEECWSDGVAQADVPSPAAQPFQDLVAEMVPAIAGKLGRGLTIPVFVQVRKQALPGEATTKAVTVPWNADCSLPKSAAGCTILIPPAGRALEARERRALVAHEVMHCYQIDLMPVAQMFALKPWVSEGMAEWVGEALSGGSKIGIEPWHEYLTRPGASVYGQAYSARGIFDHLAESGADPWSAMDALLAKGGSNAAFEVVLTAAPTFLGTWPSGYARMPNRGPAWDFTGVGILSNDIAGGGKLYQVPANLLRNGTSFEADVAPAASSIHRLDLEADVVVVSGGVVGRLGPSSGPDLMLTGSPSRTFCTLPGGCVCPSGSANEGQDFLDLPPGPMLHAVTGGTASASILVTGESLDDFCDGGQGPKAPVDNCRFVAKAELEEIMGEALETDAAEPGYGCTFSTDHGESTILEVNPSLGNATRDEYLATWPPAGTVALELGDVGYATYEQRGPLLDPDGNPFPQHEGHRFIGLCTAKVLRGNVVVTVDMLSNGMPDTGMCAAVAGAAVRQW